MTRTLTYEIRALATIDTSRSNDQVESDIEDNDLSDFEIRVNHWELIEESDEW